LKRKTKHCFVTIIRRKQGIAYKKVSKESDEKNREKISENSEKILNAITENTINELSELKRKVTEKVGEKVTEKLTDNQQKIIDNISENPYTAIQELSLIVGISRRKIEENLSKLKLFGIIERIGPDKGGYWKINDILSKNRDERVGEKVTEKQQLILNNIKENKYITSEELANIIGISAVKIRENISKLKSKGLLERIGPNNGGYWRVVKNKR
jgi:predicted HTH transcriptional regulator